MRRPRVVVLLLAALSAVAALGVTVGGAFGAEVTRATFSSDAGVVSNGALRVKPGAPVTLTVVADRNTKCARVTGDHSGAKPESGTPFVFTFTASATPGTKTVTVTAGNGGNVDGCNGNVDSETASYVVDSTGPTVTGKITPTPNGAGWNNSNVGIEWSATDDAGIKTGSLTPVTDVVTDDTASVTKTATATDALGNTATGSVTVKLDKTLPSITASRAPAANAHGWNNTNVAVGLECADTLSGIKSCTGGGTQTLTTEGANQSVPGTAIDNADNRNTAGVTGINIDKTNPTLTGAPVEQPNADGWHSDDVTVRWTAADALSGLDGVKPADKKLTGEGEGLTLTETVKDKAGNTTTAPSAPVKIDRTAPATGATAPSGWSKGDVSVTLDPNDALSGVKSTSYKLDGGAVQSGTAVVIRGEGEHTLEFWSTDKAGNVEARKTVGVDIDGTAPAIRHELARAANVNGWFREDVKVDFICEDAASGIASCGPDKLVAEEAEEQDIAGTAVDNAGNTADDHAFVSLDKTAPGVTASADRAANAAGWYNADVTVSFSATDELSGVDSVSAAEVVGEGKEQSASGTAWDAAGNQRSVQLTGINVDKTGPSLSGAAKAQPNDAGWYRDDVTVEWTASDALSGLTGDAPADSTVKGEGENLSASRTASDIAGNTTSKTVAGIKIDRTAPTTSIKIPEALANGWYAKAFEVTLTGSDALSKVAKTYYSVDGGPAKVYGGAFQFGEKGIHTITFWSVDNAGNVESKDAADHTITVKIDDLPPTITGARYPGANSFGWNNTDVDVRFECSDNESGLASGIAGCDPGTTFSADVLSDGEAHEYSGSATDNAGNSSTATVGGIKIDKTKPTLTGAPVTAANGAGWHNGDVTVKWTGSDALSGIDPATQPADTVVTGEGAAVIAGPATIADKAGNVSVPSNVTLQIDRTAPVIDGKASTSPASDAAGWYRGAVKVDFTCTDNLSGCAGGVDSKVLSTDGANQSVKSETIEDLAGNVGAGKTVGGINIDSKAPQSAADNKCEGSGGWCRTKATVVLTAEDQAGLSGVKELRYSINRGPEKSAAGARTEVEVPLMAKSGTANVSFYAVDNAGNIESPNGVALKFDNIAPTVTHTVNPDANAAGWNSADLMVHFDATDDDGGSGVDAATVTPDVRVTENTILTGRVVLGQADDVAGNRGTDSVTVKLDKTAPTITGAIVAGTKGAGDWYRSGVTVRFTCADGLSGVAACAKDVVLTDNGRGQSATGEVFDQAGNKASVTVEGINIDRNAPTIAMTGLGGDKFLLGTTPDLGCTAKDDPSTTVACSVKVAGGNTNGTGTFTYTATATDEAGNVATVTGTYSVVYRWDGFRQPINDTAHQVGTTTSIFKGGSTVPAKFQLKKADGTVVQATTAPLWLTPAKGSPTTAPVVESVYTDPGTSGSTFRYDVADGQYHYNWASPKSGIGYYHRIGVKLDDGETHFVNIGLR